MIPEEQSEDSEDWSGASDDDDGEDGAEDDDGETRGTDSPEERAKTDGTGSESFAQKAAKRISFFDQEMKTPLPQYSKESKKSVKEKKAAKKAIIAVKSGSAPAKMHQNNGTFWKIPRPTKRGTMMPASVVRGVMERQDGEDEQEENEIAKIEANVGRKKFGKKKSNLLGGDTDERPSAKFRRPSALSVFSEAGVKQQGLYELPNSGRGHEEVVEVRKQSIVMTTSMLTDILYQKLGRDGLQDRNLDAVEEQDEEIILPFFVSAMAKGETFKKCNCKIDPETGFVVHSCMTPSATLCDNTQAFQSYVCSEWGTRAQTAVGSLRASMTSESWLDADGDSDEEREEEERKTKEKMKNKRIRNASMLATVSRAAPAPAKQNTDVGGADPEKEGSDSDQDKPDENDLHVTLRKLKRTCTGYVPLSDAEVAEAEQTDDVGNRFSVGPITEDDCTGVEDNAVDINMRSLDQQVERDLGHLFNFVQPEELAQMLVDPEKREQLLVVDARGRDWVGAHIPLSINLRTSELTSHPESLIKQCQRNRIDHLIFTCMYSVLRARKSAVAVQRAQDEAVKAGHQHFRIRISLLCGGMHGWVNHWISRVDVSKNNPYIQDFDASCWCDGGPSQGGLVHVMDALWCEGGQQALSDALGDALAALQSSPTDELGVRFGGRFGTEIVGGVTETAEHTPNAESTEALPTDTVFVQPRCASPVSPTTQDASEAVAAEFTDLIVQDLAH